MNSVTFTKYLVRVQDDLLRFVYKLTSDQEEANDLLQETSLKALDNEDKYMPDTNFKGWRAILGVSMVRRTSGLAYRVLCYGKALSGR